MFSIKIFFQFFLVKNLSMPVFYSESDPIFEEIRVGFTNLETIRIGIGHTIRSGKKSTSGLKSPITSERRKMKGYFVAQNS